jgi:hypothetical protein
LCLIKYDVHLGTSGRYGLGCQLIHVGLRGGHVELFFGLAF